MSAEKFLTINELAEHAKISRSTVFKWIREGKLKEGEDFIRIGPRTVRFPYPWILEAIIESNRPGLRFVTPKEFERLIGQGAPVVNLDYDV